MALAMTCLWTTTHAQVGINTTNPTPGTILDINASDKGILIPRVNIDNPSSGTQIEGGTTNGLLVYNTNQTTGEGFYYWYNTQWIPMGSEFSWRLTGNSGINPDTNFIGTETNDHLVFRTNNVERMRILNNGRVGIRTNDPGAMLHIESTLYGAVPMGGPGIFSHITVNNSTWSAVEAFNPNTDGGAGVIGVGNVGVLGEGNVGVLGEGNYAIEGLGIIEGVYGQGLYGIVGATLNPSQNWAGYFEGNVYSTGNYFIPSDERLKTNITEISNSIDIIKSINPKYYTKTISYKTRESKSNNLSALSSKFNSLNTQEIKTGDLKIIEQQEYGFLAQELEEVLPELVIEKPTKLEGFETIKSVNYTGLIPILTKAIQEQQEIIESQEARIAKLEALVEQLLNK